MASVTLRSFAVLGLLASTIALPSGSANATATAGPAAIQLRADFNGDGYEDLAFGVPTQAVAGQNKAGRVDVLYGGANGLRLPYHSFAQGQGGIFGTPETGDNFGSALAAGDFDGDGYTDLAIGAEGESVAGVDGAGGLHVLYGSSIGLTAAGDSFFREGTGGLVGVPGAGDELGAALAAGDFTGDGLVDLAVGVPNNDYDHNGVRRESAGAVYILFGQLNGLSGTGSRLLEQGVGGVPGTPAYLDLYGSVLAAGDVNGDGRADLAIGTPDEDLNVSGTTMANAGSVQVILGASTGLGNAETLKQGLFLGDDPEAGDRFGHALAIGNYNGDAYGDLAIGVPQEDVSSVSNAGLVQVVFGSASGLSASSVSQLVWEGAGGINDVLDTDDVFGSSLAAGDFNGDSVADLAVGAPKDTLPTVPSGAVFTLLGTWSGLTGSGGQVLRQGTGGLPDRSPEGAFGHALAAGDHNADGRVDLVVGAPWETIGGLPFAGLVQSLRAEAGGLVASWMFTKADGWQANSVFGDVLAG